LTSGKVITTVPTSFTDPRSTAHHGFSMAVVHEYVFGSSSIARDAILAVAPSVLVSVVICRGVAPPGIKFSARRAFTIRLHLFSFGSIGL